MKARDQLQFWGLFLSISELYVYINAVAYLLLSCCCEPSSRWFKGLAMWHKKEVSWKAFGIVALPEKCWWAWRLAVFSLFFISRQAISCICVHNLSFSYMSNLLKVKAFLPTWGHMVILQFDIWNSRESKNAVYEHLQRAAVSFIQTLWIDTLCGPRHDLINLENNFAEIIYEWYL